MKLIDAITAADKIESTSKSDLYTDAAKEAFLLVANHLRYSESFAPTISVDKLRTAEWIVRKNGVASSLCETYFRLSPGDENYCYCPQCGAKMTNVEITNFEKMMKRIAEQEGK